MAKAKTTAFSVKNADMNHQMAGQCPACRAWNTLVEEPVAKMAPAGKRTDVC